MTDEARTTHARHVAVEPPDIVWGAEGIARVINKETRQAFHLLEQGQLPARKVGNRWVASRTKLLEHLTGGGQ